MLRFSFQKKCIKRINVEAKRGIEGRGKEKKGRTIEEIEFRRGKPY
jgi:hypothetical protein